MQQFKYCVTMLRIERRVWRCLDHHCSPALLLWLLHSLQAIPFGVKCPPSGDTHMAMKAKAAVNALLGLCASSSFRSIVPPWYSELFARWG